MTFALCQYKWRILKQSCSLSSQGKVFIILDPYWHWNWTAEGVLSSLQDQYYLPVVSLRCWSSGAVSNALEQLKLPTKSKVIGQQIFELTAGIHCLVTDILKECKGKGSSKDVVTSTERIKKSLLENRNSRLLSKLGVDDSDLGKAVQEVFWLADQLEDAEEEYFITDYHFEFAKEIFEESSPSWNLLKNKSPEIIEWLSDIDLIWVGDRGKDLDENDEVKYKVCPVTREFIVQSEK